MSLRNNKKSLAIGVMFALITFVTVGTLILNSSPKQAPVKPAHLYVVAKNEIKNGDLIKEEDVEIKDIGVAIEGTYKATGEVVGRNADKDIAVGKPIMKSFIKSIIVKEAAPEGIEPKEGFRAVPLLVKKSSLPPYLSMEALFDLFTKENSMVIENLRILNILNPTKDEANKMLVLEIKAADVPTFIENQVSTQGFIFVQKNPNEYGNYNFHIPNASKKQKEVVPQKTSSRETEELIPPINDVFSENTKSVNNLAQSNPPAEIKNYKEVEVITGNTKTKMEFEN